MTDVPAFGTLAKVRDHYETPWTPGNTYSLYQWALWVAVGPFLGTGAHIFLGLPEYEANLVVGSCIIAVFMLLAAHIALKVVFDVKRLVEADNSTDATTHRTARH